jgi:hypothetical protein
MMGRLSAPQPRLTGKFVGGDSGHGLGWGLFLKVRESVASLFCKLKLACIITTKF